MRHRLKSLVDNIRRRFGITAPKVIVRTHFSSGVVGLVVIVLLLCGALVGYFVATQSGGSGGECDLLQMRLRQQNEEVERLRSFSGGGESLASMERAAQQQLLGKISLLEEENRKLKEDMLLLEKLVPGVGGGRVRIENFKVIRNAGALPRYVLLLAYVPAKPGVAFRGRLQLVVSYSLAGQKFRVVYPQQNSRSSDFDLEIRHSVYKEGVLDLPSGAELRNLEAMVLQGDSLKTKGQAAL